MVIFGAPRPHFEPHEDVSVATRSLGFPCTLCGSPKGGAGGLSTPFRCCDLKEVHDGPRLFSQSRRFFQSSFPPQATKDVSSLGLSFECLPLWVWPSSAPPSSRRRKMVLPFYLPETSLWGGLGLSAAVNPICVLTQVKMIFGTPTL